MKGIILAAGTGTRLHPITKCISKQLLPIYNKPMIYYPLSVLMLAGIKDILIITNPEHRGAFEGTLGCGEKLGLNIEYRCQEHPRGIAEAFIIGEEFIKDSSVCLILGDNIFYGTNLLRLLSKSIKKIDDGLNKSIIFGYSVNNPKHYGVIEYNKEKDVISIEEKPMNPKSNCAAVGLYMYDNSVVEVAKNLEPSSRGELEITDINKHYLNEGKLTFDLLGRGCAWFDTGNCDDAYEAINFVRTVEKRQGLMISNIEEIAYRMKYINKKKLETLVEDMSDNSYKNYLVSRVLRRKNG